MTTSQLKVIECLLVGRSITGAADEAGVSRSTIYRWFRDDSEFMAAYNMERRLQYETTSRRLVALSEGAVTCIEQAIQSGDIRTALSLLRGIGSLNGSVPSFGDESARRLEIAARQEEAQIELEELLTI